MYIGRHVRYPLFLSGITETQIFSTDLKKNTQIWNLMKIRPVGAELFFANGRTADMTKLIGASRNFAKSA